MGFLFVFRCKEKESLCRIAAQACEKLNNL